MDLPYDVQTGYKERTVPYKLDFIQVGPFRGENYLGQPTKPDNFIGQPHTTFIQFTTRITNP
ncbi:hypothetical protein QWY86_19925 [Pedobacter aquatilis]|nr:hypothetical protein [Pedobacter aquatilis]